MRSALCSHPSTVAAVLLVAGGMALPAQSPIGTLVTEQSRTAFTVQGAGARAMGLGGAFIAVADDATAVSFNPAGLAQLIKPEASLVLRGIQRRVSYEDFERNASATRVLAVSDSVVSGTRVDPLFVSASLPIRVNERTLALQLSLQRAFALGEYSDRTLKEVDPLDPALPPRNLTQRIDQSGQIDLTSLAVSYEASQRVLIGLAYNQWRGRWDLASRSTKEDGTARSFVAFNQYNELEGSNLNLGLIWRWPTWRLGLVHRTAFHADYSFATTVSTNLDLKGYTGDPRASYGVHWPATTGLGFAVRPKERLLLALDASYTDWSKTRFMTASSGLNGRSFFDYLRTSRTPSATDLHLGAEFLLITGKGRVVPLRAGLSREPQPISDRLTGKQRVLYAASLGSGFRMGSATFDAAYRFGWGHRRASQFLEVDKIITGQLSGRATGNERFHEHRLDFSMILQFDRQPVERALRHLFVGD